MPPPPRTGPNARLLRRLLLTLVLGVVGSVVWTYRRSSEARPPAPAPTPTMAAAGDTRTENLVFKKFQGERLAWMLTAREMVGKEDEEMRLTGVDFAFSYVA